MNEDVIRSLWELGKRQEPHMGAQEISDILSKSVRKGWTKLRLNVWVYGAMAAVALIFSLLNLLGNLSNSPWNVVHLVLTVMTLVFLALSVRVYRRLRGLDEPDQSVAVLVRRQLRFFHSTFEWWLWVASVTTWMLIFSLVVWIDDQIGGYSIVAPVEFVAVSAAVMFGGYALLRLGHYPLVQRSLAALHDLESQITEQTRKVQAWRKYWIIAAGILVVLTVAAVVWTISVWISATR
jgi:hypothetical protein